MPKTLNHTLLCILTKTFVEVLADGLMPIFRFHISGNILDGNFKRNSSKQLFIDGIIENIVLIKDPTTRLQLISSTETVLDVPLNLSDKSIFLYSKIATRFLNFETITITLWILVLVGCFLWLYSFKKCSVISAKIGRHKARFIFNVFSIFFKSFFRCSINESFRKWLIKATRRTIRRIRKRFRLNAICGFCWRLELCRILSRNSWVTKLFGRIVKKRTLFWMNIFRKFFN